MNVSVFREALRLARRIPSQAIRRKFKYNMREIAEYYSHSDDSTRRQQIDELARKALWSLSRLLDADGDTVRATFRPLEYATRIEESLDSKRSVA